MIFTIEENDKKKTTKALIMLKENVDNLRAKPVGQGLVL